MTTKAPNRYLLDAGILPLLLAGDARLKPLVQEMSDGRAEALASEVNLAEFYYKTCESRGREVAEHVYRRIRIMKELRSLSPDQELTKRTGQLKCTYRGKVSLADCFAAATAEREEAKLVTTDSELEKMARKEGIKTLFLAI